MATIWEKFGSRPSSEGDNPSVELLYIIDGTDSDLTAKSLLGSTTPLIYDGLVRQTWDVTPIGPEMWEGSVMYGRRQRAPPTGASQYQFSTGGGTQHIKQSLGTVGAYVAAGDPFPAPDHKGAVGVTADSVEGVDIGMRAYSFSETHYLPLGFVDDAYKNILFLLTRTVNANVFRLFAPGECLLDYVAGSQRGQEDWELAFHFIASPNATNLTLGDITVASKGGWEYLWVDYRPAVDSSAFRIVKRPFAAYVERVYYSTNFSQLGIG